METFADHPNILASDGFFSQVVSWCCTECTKYYYEIQIKFEILRLRNFRKIYQSFKGTEKYFLNIEPLAWTLPSKSLSNYVTRTVMI